MHPRTLLDLFATGTHCSLLFNLVSQVSLVFQLIGPQHVLVHRVIFPQMQDFAFLLVELEDNPIRPFLLACQESLDGHISHYSQFGVISKFAGGYTLPHYPNRKNADQDRKQY